MVASLKLASSRWADRFVMDAKWPGVADHVRITSGLRLFPVDMQLLDTQMARRDHSWAGK